MASFFIPYDENVQLSDGQWNGYTLILPCVSVGNVPQLTTDLLINMLIKTNDDHHGAGKDLELIGYIRSENVHPFAGPDPFSIHGQLFATSIQVFVSKSKKLIIIQQRSPIYKERRNEFYAELSDWISKHNFSLILLLTSSFDHYLVPGLNQDNIFPISYLSVNLDDFLQSNLEKLDLKPVKHVDPHTMAEDSKGRIHLPGSGSARAYVKRFGSLTQVDAEKKETKIICLVMYCSEGDNRLHAFKLADKVAVLLNRSETVFEPSHLREFGPSGDEFAAGEKQFDWIIPFSWRTMFGDEAPSEIF